VGRHDPKWIQEGLKIKVSELDETNAIASILRIYIFFSKNGHRMRKLSCFDRFPKQAKKSTGQSQ
jgi:hypothetical protein